jgi:hypothetical protein
MYTFVLDVHSWLRWFALVAGFAATFTAFSDRSEIGARSRADIWGLVFMTLLDIQMLLGLLLYLVLSPFTAEAMKDFGAAMRNPGLRFFAVEHLALMLAAVVLAHLGRALARKAKSPAVKRHRRFLCFGLATLAMLIAIPWPGLPNGRPLFRI